MDGLRNIGANMSGLLRGKLPFLYRFVQCDLNANLSVKRLFIFSYITFSFVTFSCVDVCRVRA